MPGMLAMGLSVYDYQDFLDRGWRRSGHWLYKVRSPPSRPPPLPPPLASLLSIAPCSPPLQYLAACNPHRGAVIKGR